MQHVLPASERRTAAAEAADADVVVLLPPSETKAPGGDGRPLHLPGLAFARDLTAARERVIEWLTALCADQGQAASALRLTPRQAGAIADDRIVASAPTMVAADRYTGVLYDALDAATLSTDEREWLGCHVFVQSALFGLISLTDQIPCYRLSAGTRKSVFDLGGVWKEPGTAVLDVLLSEGKTVLDLRSKAYAALAPLPEHPHAFCVEVVSRDANGERRPLNHFNKAAKGAFVRYLAEIGTRRQNEGSCAAGTPASNLLQDAARRMHAQLKLKQAPVQSLLEVQAAAVGAAADAQSG